nr:recombinase family protein [Micromonospora sp. DSM 115978]
DNGRSASEFARRDREEWDRLMSDLRAGRGDALWLWEASRGDRKLTEWSALLDYCHAHGVLIHVSSHERTYDMANDRDWETLAEEGIRSAAESKKISKRVRRGTAGSIRAGKPIGTVPYGYRRRYDPDTKKLVAQEPDPDTAPVVAEVVAKVAKSKALTAVARELNERGVVSPGGNVWSASTVRRIASNEVYVSRRSHNGETHAGQW